MLQLGTMTQKLRSSSPDDVVEAASYFRRLLSIEEDPPIREVIMNGAVGPLVNLLRSQDSPQLQFDAAWALTNIASGTSEDTRIVVEAGAIMPFVQLLRSATPQVREQAAWALGNIAGDCAQLRDMVLQAGALQPVLGILQPNMSDVSTLRNATWTLSNFCRGRQTDEHLSMVQAALPMLAQLVQSNDPGIVIDSCWALSYISNGTPKHVNAVLDLGVVGRLVNLTAVPDESDLAKVRLPALRTIGNIIAGDDRQTEAALRANAVPALLHLASTARRRLFRKEACWTLSNITAGTMDQIDMVIKFNGVPILMQRLTQDDATVKTEACWAISNALVGGELRHAEFFVQAGVIDALVGVLQQGQQPTDLTKVALEALERILDIGETESARRGAVQNHFDAYFTDAAFECFDRLQSHDSDEVHELVLKILDTYFQDALDYDDDAACEQADDAHVGMDQDPVIHNPAPIAAQVPHQFQQPAQQQQQQQFSFGAAPPEHGSFSSFQ